MRTSFVERRGRRADNEPRQSTAIARINCRRQSSDDLLLQSTIYILHTEIGHEQVLDNGLAEESGQGKARRTASQPKLTLSSRSPVSLDKFCCYRELKHLLRSA